MKHRGKPFLSFILALALLLTACGGGGNAAAATMHLVKTKGTVNVDNEQGKTIKVRENLGLFSGYSVVTQAASYGWVNMDDTRLAKLDESSKAEIQKNGKLLELYVRSGNLFFNVTEPLAEDEAMNIRTSSMIVGVRGTCGWIEVEGEDLMCVYLLRGKVECTVLDENGGVLSTTDITAGQAAMMEANGQITIAEFDTGNLPAFVAEAIDHPEDWSKGSPKPDTAGGDAANASYSRFFRGPKILRCLSYWIIDEDRGEERLDGYDEYLYDEQGNYIGLKHYSIDGNNVVLDYTFMEKYTFDNQGRIREIQTNYIKPSEEEGVGRLETVQEQGPDYVVLGDDSIQRRDWYYYNDLNQCVRTDDGTSVGGPRGLSPVIYEYDAQGKIINSYSESVTSNGPFARYVYEYEGDVLTVIGQEEPAGVTPEDTETPEPQENTSGPLLAAYVGTYTPYPAYDSYSRGRSVTMDENGVFTGGETNGRTPTSISQNADGSIAVLFGSNERYTIYPVGVPTPSYFQGVNASEVNIEYLDTGGGAMNIVYHADPASLGTP